MSKEKKESGFFNIITKMHANVTPANTVPVKVTPTKATPTKAVSKKPTLTQSVKEQKDVAKEEMFDLSIDCVIPNPHQPRRAFNQTSLNELAASIQEHGILQPILVYKNGDKYIIIAGERRFRAAQSLGLQKVPVILKEASKKEQKELALVENIHRENLNPIEEAEAIYGLVVEHNLTQEEVAKALGKSRPVVANTLRLLRLPTYIKEMIKEGKLTAGHGRALLSLKEEALQLKYAKEAALKKMSVHELERKVNKLLLSKSGYSKPIPQQQSRELKAMQTDMQRIFATKVTISGNESQGKIQISYFSKEELQKIFDIIEEIRGN